MELHIKSEIFEIIIDLSTEFLKLFLILVVSFWNYFWS